jgi:AcrR family transcriptional regulator
MDKHANKRLDTQKTRQRLLAVACKIFAEKGYQKATIAEISRQAKTNIASVNYHFQDKENLYFEAWRYAFRQDVERYPSDGGVNIGCSPEERLAGRIRSLITRIADPKSYFFAIVHWELAHQTRLFEKIIQQEIMPEREAMSALIAELLGSDATEKQIRFCHASIIGQCFHLLQVLRLQANASLQKDLELISDTDAFIEHVIQFSLAGIDSLRSNKYR